METTPSRADWQQHHVRILQGYNTLLETLKRLPTQAEVAQHTGLHRNTVSRHMLTLLTGDEALEHAMGYVVQFQNLVNKLMVRAATMTDDRAMRLFFQVMGNTRLLTLLHSQAADWHGTKDNAVETEAQAAPQTARMAPSQAQTAPQTPAPNEMVQNGAALQQPEPQPTHGHLVSGDDAAGPQTQAQTQAQNWGADADGPVANAPMHWPGNRHQRRQAQRQAHKTVGLTKAA